MPIIKIQIGDWSGDGHEQHEDFLFDSNKPIEDVREAYFAVRTAYPNLSPEEFCSAYEDHEVPESIVEAAGASGFDPDSFDTEQMAAYVAWFCMQGDPDLRLSPSTAPLVPTLAFYGFDEKSRHIGFIGYGLF